MRQALMLSAVVGAVVVAAVATVVAVGSLRWRRATARVEARLAAHATENASELDQGVGGSTAALPPPVARYLAFAGASDHPPVHRARVSWQGTFRMRPDGPWNDMMAEQLYTTSPPGFVWDARIRMAPLLTVRVRDSYIAREGEIHGAVAGLLTVVDEGGTPELAASALARLLGEMIWLPTALLPGPGLEWTALDDSTARARLTDGGVTVEVDFHFGQGGEVVGVSGERYRDVGGVGVLTPWRARVWDYEQLDGMMVPRNGEVEWVLPDGAFPYWRGQVVSADYDW